MNAARPSGGRISGPTKIVSISEKINRILPNKKDPNVIIKLGQRYTLRTSDDSNFLCYYMAKSTGGQLHAYLRQGDMDWKKSFTPATLKRLILERTIEDFYLNNQLDTNFY